MKNNKIYVNHKLYNSNSMEPILDFLLTKKNIFKFYINFKKINNKNDYISVYLDEFEESNEFILPLFVKNIVSALKE